MNINKIGIFDSGVGGLTVYKEIRQILPQLDIVYFGDTARVPYGSKTKKTIVSYSIENVKFLISKNVQLVVVACNTASAYSLNILKKMFDIPIIGVIDFGVEMAIKNTENNKIAVIGTEATIKSEAYQKKIKKKNNQIEIFSKACPLFVPLVEENFQNHLITDIMIKEYLSDLIGNGIDTLILGCTHYPVLKNQIKANFPNINLVDSAKAVSIYLEEKIKITNTKKGKEYFFVSDNEKKFNNFAQKILNLKNVNAKQIKLT